VRSLSQIAESFDLGGVSPCRRKRLGGERCQDRLAKKGILLPVTGPQFEPAVDRAVERAGDGAVALANHYPVRLQTLQKWSGLVTVVERCRGQMAANYTAEFQGLATPGGQAQPRCQTVPGNRHACWKAAPCDPDDCCMKPIAELLNDVGVFLNAGIAGSEFTPLKLIIVITLISALVWVTHRVTRWFVDKVLARRGFDIGMREALGAIVRYGAVTLGTLVILQSAGINLTSLNVLVGAIGVGLGFGLQNIMNNFFSGLIILFERPIKIGDRIEIAGAVGEVRDIAARATTLITDDSVAIVVPNSQFISERVTNWSRPGKLTAYVVSFHVSHASDPEFVRRVLLAAAARHPDVLREPAPQVEFVEAGLAALRFQMQVWSTEHLKSAGRLKSDLNFDVWRELAASGVVVPPVHGPLTLGLQLDESSKH